MKPTISVIIPVRNGAATLERCLSSLCSQSVRPEEIIILDTNSTDSSIAIAQRYGAKIFPIEEEKFDHGLTRNEGLKYCLGDFIYLTVQDAWIPENNMLERMVSHFQNPEVMAVCGHQAVPHEKDKNPLKWYRRYSEHNVHLRRIDDGEEFKNLAQHAQQKLVAWDNVIAMYRASALRQLPFVQTQMAEDWVWSYHALLKGWTLLRDSSLLVFHYHHQTFKYVFRTSWSVNYHFYKFFNYKPTLSSVFTPGLKAVYHLFRNKELSPGEKLYWSSHNLLERIGTWYANFVFLLRLRLGGLKYVEKGYYKFCKKIPQGKLRNGLN